MDSLRSAVGKTVFIRFKEPTWIIVPTKAGLDRVMAAGSGEQLLPVSIDYAIGDLSITDEEEYILTVDVHRGIKMQSILNIENVIECHFAYEPPKIEEEAEEEITETQE